jgi:glycosyltransferase involved in cell wall biosynthesis
MLIEASAPLVRDGSLVVDVIGDGPELERLRGIVQAERVGSGVFLDGWVSHEKLQERLLACQLFGFPSVREFGGAVVLEAMASGLVPIVVGYAGPNELVSASTGVRIPIGPRDEIVSAMRSELRRLIDAPELVAQMSVRARERTLRSFTWSAKAAQVVEVYRWVLGERGKPDFGMPLPDP